MPFLVYGFEILTKNIPVYDSALGFSRSIQQPKIKPRLHVTLISCGYVFGQRAPIKSHYQILLHSADSHGSEEEVTAQFS